MHTIHHTEAFILKKVASGEANVRVWLFTKEFGLVIAMVQGVRKSGAKLHMQLSEYARIRADLVRGREVWRLVSALEEETLFLDGEHMLGRFFVRTLQAVERFCHGEEQHLELFEHLQECQRIVSGRKGDELLLDTLSLWKVLVLLGYLPVSESDERFLSMSLLEGAADIDDATRRRLIKDTNDAIKATHL